MSVASPRARRALCALMTAAQTLWIGRAFAIDKAACVEAAEAGQRLRKQGHLVAAREQLVVCASPDCPEVVSQDCTGWLGEVQRSLASFVVRARDASGNALHDVTVFLDGNVLPETAPTASIGVDPGEHQVRCELPGFAPSEQRVALAGGDRDREIDCDLVSLTPAPSQVVEPPRPSLPVYALKPVPGVAQPPVGVPWVVWPLAGLGVAGIAGFVVFGVSGLNEEHALTCAPNCKAADVAPVQTKFTVADVSLAVAAVALGVAVVTMIVHSTGSAPRSAAAYTTTARGGPFQLPPAPH